MSEHTPPSSDEENEQTPERDDATRPNRRITHPDRTRYTPRQPQPPKQQPSTPAQNPSRPAQPDQKPATPPVQPPGHPSREQAPQSPPTPAQPARPQREDKQREETESNISAPSANTPTPSRPKPNYAQPTQPIRPQPRPDDNQKQPSQPVRTPEQKNPTTHTPRHYRNPIYQQTKPSEQPPPQIKQQPTVRVRPKRRKPKPQRNFAQRMMRAGLTVSALGLIAGALFLAISVFMYFTIASQLPPAQELQGRSFRFATTKILDRNGNLLWEIIDPTGGRRTRVSLDEISPNLIRATVATEDRFFYQNVGVDPIAVARAVYYNVTEGEIVSGASTITQQLARNVLLDPEERNQRSIMRKVREAVLAVEINRRYTKEEILEIYLNQIYYGNLAYGIEAASQTYFGKSAEDLTLAEAAMLAGLPQAPAFHDPYTNPEGAKNRQADVLRLMAEANYITANEAEDAHLEALPFREPSFAFESPHFVTYVRQELERIFGPDLLYQVGVEVTTTLDPRLQSIAEEEVTRQVNALAGRDVSNGALVTMDVETGQILAFVGSKDFEDEAIAGQINMALTPRQPGSSIKPLTYLATFEMLDWTPSTLIMDTEVEYPDGAGGVYSPQNYDKKYHGPTSIRLSLANSYNIPPVKALALVGVDALKEMSSRLGITTLTRNDYGVALTLGAGEVPLIEMVGAYQAIANGGVKVQPTSIVEIRDKFGRVIEPARPQPVRVLNEAHAYLITHILADNEARTPAMGPNSPMKLSRPAAAKTGTTTDFRDSWIVGYTTNYVTGVWVGNADNTPMNGIGGSNGAGPIWNQFMERAHEGVAIEDFTRPSSIVELEVCADSGTIPSEVCPQRRTEVFYQPQPPLGPEHDIHQLIEIDRNTGKRANEFCRGNVEQRYYRVYPPDGWEWAEEQGYEQPPANFCPSANLIADITQPLDGSTARGIISLEGSVGAANFSHYQIELGEGTNPEEFVVISGPVNSMVERGVLGRFDSNEIENGPYTLRVRVFDQTGGEVETRIRLLVDNVPTPAPTETPTPTMTPTQAVDTATPTPELTATPTATPELPTETPTIPADTPTPEPTIAPDTPTPEPTLPADTPTPEPPTNTPVPEDTPTEAPPTEEPTSEPPAEEPTTEPTEELPTPSA